MNSRSWRIDRSLAELAGAVASVREWLERTLAVIDGFLERGAIHAEVRPMARATRS